MNIIKTLGKLSCLVLSVSACVSTQKIEEFESVLHRNEVALQRSTDMIAKQHELLAMMSAEQGHLQQQISHMQTVLESKQAPPHTADITSAKTGKKSKKKPITAATLPSLANNSEPLPDGKMTLGRHEWLWFDALNRFVPAYLDTGRKTSLLGVSNLQNFERDGKNWVRFTLAKGGADDSAEPMSLAFPIVRMLSVRLPNDDLDKRPVIRMKITLGQITEVAEFSLSEKEVQTPVILGRNFLRDIAVVDVSKSYTQAKTKPE